MIDTIMVLWTSGLWKSFLRNTGSFLLLFTGICALLLLVTTSGSRWPGLAVTVARPGSFATSTTVQPAPAPTAAPTAITYIVPIIPQNPILPNAHISRSDYKRSSHHHAPIYTPPAQPTQAAVPTSPPDTGFQNPSNPLQNIP
jgi:hypothetical protein